jgi:hypothetical protein
MRAAELFERYFLPLYPADARADLARARVTDANPVGNPSLVAHLEEAAAAFVHNAPALFGTDLGLDGSDASVHRLGGALTHERRDEWASMGAPGSSGNALFNAVVHGSAYVGTCIIAHHDALWSIRRPLWESFVLLRSAAGLGQLAIFHWWLKSLADDGQGATLGDRYRALVEVPCAKLEGLTLLVAKPRRMPRLARPRYASLCLYLRAHVPELKNLGDDFPSAARFEALGLRWIDGHIIGSGRMLLLAGASEAGLHLFWLSHAGFEKSAFFPGDPGTDPCVEVEGDRILARTIQEGRPRSHDLLWWGP